MKVLKRETGCLPIWCYILFLMALKMLMRYGQSARFPRSIVSISHSFAMNEARTTNLELPHSEAINLNTGINIRITFHLAIHRSGQSLIRSWRTRQATRVRVKRWSQLYTGKCAAISGKTCYQCCRVLLLKHRRMTSTNRMKPSSPCFIRLLELCQTLYHMF